VLHREKLLFSGTRDSLPENLVALSLRAAAVARFAGK